AGEQEVIQLQAVAQEDLDGELGERSHLAVDFHLLLEQTLGHVARADMEAERQVEFAGDLPQRVPVLIAKERQAVILRLTGKEDAAMAHFLASANFLNGLVDVPEG